MKKYLNLIIFLILQVLIFYLLPLVMTSDSFLIVIFLMLILTFLLTVICTILLDMKIKYFYPLIVALIFIPTVFIYYNESALIHTLWYFLDSLIGLMIGICIYKLRKKK